MNVVCGHCGKAVNAALDVGQGLLCPRCGSKVSPPDLTAEAAQPPDPDETHVFEAIDVSFADQAREAMKKTSKIHLTCGSCGRHLTIGARLAGKRAKCPNCKSHIRVPYPDDQDDFEIEALAMAIEEPVEELDLSYGEAPPAAAHALREAESRTAGPAGLGPDKRRKAVHRRHEARVRQIKRSQRKLIAFVAVTALVAGLLVWLLAWPLVFGNGRREPAEDGGNARNVAAVGNGNSGRNTGQNGNAGDGNGGAAATRPRPPRRKPRFRVVRTQVSPFAHDGYFPASLGKAYWHVTIDIQAGSDPFVMKTAGTQVVVTAMGQEFVSLGTPGGGGLLPRKLSRPTVTIAPRKIQRMELLFELPAAYRHGTLVLADVGSEGLDAGDTFVAADPLKLIGTFKEALPRNLEPLLEHPVMAALQSGGPGEMTVRAVRGGYGLAFHASGVRGLATYNRSGIYDVTLRHEGERLACKLQLIDSGKRALLHLANKPWRTMTFVRDGASLDETPHPQTQPRTRPIPPTKTPRREDDDEQDDRRPSNNGEVNEPRFFDD